VLVLSRELSRSELSAPAALAPKETLISENLRDSGIEDRQGAVERTRKGWGDVPTYRKGSGLRGWAFELATTSRGRRRMSLIYGKHERTAEGRGRSMGGSAGLFAAERAGVDFGERGFSV